MRLPFLQVTQEAWGKGRTLAGLLGVSRREAFGIICDLWQWALDETCGDIPKEQWGLMIDPHWGEIIAATLEWPQERRLVLTDAMERVGLLEKREIGCRIKGLDRYYEAWAKAQRDKDRKRQIRTPPERRADGAGIPTDGAGIPSDGAGQTKTHTKTKIEKESKATAPPPLKAVDLRDPLSGPDAFFAEVQDERARVGLPREKPPRPEQLARWWSEALMELNGNADLVVQAYRGFTKDPFWRDKQPPTPFHGFVSQWRKYVPAQSVRRATGN